MNCSIKVGVFLGTDRQLSILSVESLCKQAGSKFLQGTLLGEYDINSLTIFPARKDPVLHMTTIMAVSSLLTVVMLSFIILDVPEVMPHPFKIDSKLPGSKLPTQNGSSQQHRHVYGNKILYSGEDANPGQFKFFVYVFSSDESNRYSCGGALLPNHWVITSAHCVFTQSGERMDPTNISVVGGIERRSDLKEGFVWRVKEIHVYPEYVHTDSPLNKTDLALLRLNPIIDYSLDPNRVSSILLPNGQDDFKYLDRKCYILGAGRTNHSSSGLLQYNEVNVRNKLRSRDKMRDHLHLIHGYACPGDSGSPMVCIHSTNGVETLKIHSIVTGGSRQRGLNPCEGPIRDYVTILTNLEHFENWIREVQRERTLPLRRLKAIMRLVLGTLFLLLFLVSIATGVLNYFRKPPDVSLVEYVCHEKNAGPRAEIYCQGRILEAVMALKLFDDSKIFVDKPLKFPPKVVIEKFEQTFPEDENITRDALSTFIDANFEEEGTELEKCNLTDWTEKPQKLAEIRDPVLREFAFSINKIWRDLCRRVKSEVSTSEDRHSLISVPHAFIIPGGRFREYYYWDSYWIIKGLLASGMYETTRNMLSNFVDLVERIGFVPNGGRIYYLARSQPPLLIPMFYEYLEATGDFDFVQKSLPTLEKELRFWDDRRSVAVTVGGRQYKMYQYRAESNVPRPESYREDVELVKDKPWNEKAVAWKNLASAAESGMDFSSKWFQNYTELKTIDTTNIVPVELNGFICWNMEILSHFYSLIPGATSKENMYRERHSNFKRDFQNVFYVKDEYGWYDYNLRTQKNNVEFYSSNIVPLFTRCYDSLDHFKAEKVYERIKKFGAFGFNSGIPTSLHKNTGQQWDFPNSWPPLEHLIIEGLRRSESPQLQDVAFNTTKVWIRTNYNAYNAKQVFWEKYDVDGQIGAGGEYVVQAGFGWTNGVLLDLLVSYSDRLDFGAVQATGNDSPITTSEALIRARRFSRRK